MDNISEFIKCKNLEIDPKVFEQEDFNKNLDFIIMENNNCLNTGNLALIQIKGNSLEKEISNAINTSIVRIKAENKIFEKLKTAKKDEMNEVGKFQYHLTNFVKKDEKKQWEKVQSEIKQLSEPQTSSFQFSDFFSLVIGLGLLLFLHAQMPKYKDFKNKNNIK